MAHFSIQLDEVTDLNVAHTQDPGDLSGPALAWENMKLASKMKQCDLFGMAAAAWLKATPTADFRVLEERLRHENVETHIIAVSVPDDLNPIDFIHPKGTAVDRSAACRMAIYSCGPKEFTRKEFEIRGITYAENFSRLSHALIQRYFLEEAIAERLEGVPGKLLRNTHLLDVIQTEAATYYDDVIRKYTVKLGHKPKETLIAMSDTGGPVVQATFRQEGSWEPVFDLVETIDFGPEGKAPRQRRRIMRVRE